MTQSFVIDSQHSRLGPSSSERWLSCQGSVLYTKDMPNPTSVYAAHGIMAHTVSEWCRRQSVSAKTFVGRELKVDEHEFRVNFEMAQAVDDFCTYVGKIPGFAFYEQRVSYEPWVPGGFGTLDDARVVDYLCNVTDFKFGKGIRVSARDNSQLKLYALGLYWNYRHLWEFEDFVLRVFQPRIEADGPNEFHISLDDLLTWADGASAIAARALHPGAPFKAGAWCQFCPAKRVCDVYAKSQGRGVDVTTEFQNLDAREDFE